MSTPRKKTTKKRPKTPYVTSRAKGVEVLEGHIGTRPTHTVSAEKWVPDETVVDRVSELLARRHTINQCKMYIKEYATKKMEDHMDALREETGVDYLVWPVDSETLDTVVNRARQMVLDRANIEVRCEQATAVAFYESVIRDPESTFIEKMKAQDSLRAMFGIGQDHAKQAESSDTVGEKLRALIGAALTSV